MDSQQPRDVFCIDLVKLNAYMEELVAHGHKTATAKRLTVPSTRYEDPAHTIYCYAKSDDFGHAVPFETVYHLGEDEFIKLFFVKKDRHIASGLYYDIRRTIPGCVFVVDDYPNFDFEAAMKAAKAYWERTQCDPAVKERLTEEWEYLEFKTADYAPFQAPELPETQSKPVVKIEPQNTQYICRNALRNLLHEAMQKDELRERNELLVSQILPGTDLNIEDRVGIYRKATLECVNEDFSYDANYLDLRNINHMTDQDIARFVQLDPSLCGSALPLSVRHAFYLLRIAADTLEGILERNKRYCAVSCGEQRGSMPSEIAAQLVAASLQRLRLEIEYLYSIRYRELGTVTPSVGAVNVALKDMATELDTKVKALVLRNNGVENDITSEE